MKKLIFWLPVITQKTLKISKDSLITIEEKLDSKGNSEDFNDIKNALVAIETKLSKNTVSETLNNLDDIKNTLGSI